MQTKDLYWLAGLLEGEGYFYVPSRTSSWGSPRVYLRMNDRDVVEKARRICGNIGGISQIERANSRASGPSYEWRVNGARAIGLMLTLYPLLGTRRQERVRKILVEWRERPPRKGGRRKLQYATGY